MEAGNSALQSLGGIACISYRGSKVRGTIGLSKAQSDFLGELSKSWFSAKGIFLVIISRQLATGCLKGSKGSSFRSI